MLGKDAKYIIFDDGLNYVPIIFPNHVQHNSVAMMFGSWKPERAGFVSINESGDVIAHGKSISLGLDSRPEIDNKLLAKMFNK